MRTVDVPPFLRTLLAGHLDASDNRKCTCRYAPPTGDRIPWCTGDEYVFLSPNQSHFRRSNYSVRVMRPAADGWHPGHAGRAPRPTMPVLVDMGDGWPGKPLPPQPPVVPGQPYTPRTGRGIRRVRDDETVASWLPILPGLTPHGLRHGHQTWMDEVNTSYVLQSERMGHEVPGMRGIYSHITPRMRGRLMEDFQEMWELSLTQRAKLSTRSAVGALNGLLASRGSRPTIIL